MARQYFFSQEHKAKLAARKAVREKEIQLKRLSKKLDNTKEKLKLKKEAIGIVDQASNPNKKSKQGTILETSQFDNLPKQVKELLETEKDRIVFNPNAGPQSDFLAATSEYCLL